jgi:hypothetical protein
MEEMMAEIIPEQEDTAIGQLVQDAFRDGMSNGSKRIIKLIENEIKEGRNSEALTQILGKLNKQEHEKQSIIKMRPAAHWIQGLEELCRIVKERFGSRARMVEIGCYSGEGTEVFAKNIGTVFAIDPWCAPAGATANEDVNNYTYKLNVAERVFDAMRSRFRNIVKLKGFDHQFADGFPDDFFEAVYIDGNHYYKAVKENTKLWIGKVRSDGFFCGHDYYDVTPQVVRAVDEVFEKPDYMFDDASWAVDMSLREIRFVNGELKCPRRK